MTVLASIEEHVGRLVHPSVSSMPVEAVRHRTFIATRIGLSCAALALAPLYLVTGGIPGWCDGVLLALMLVPLLAAAHVSNTGQLATGQALCAAAWIGMALTAFIGHDCGLGTACALLFVVPVEVVTTASRRIGAGLMCAAGAALVTILAVAIVQDRAPAASAQGAAVLLLFAFAHMAALTWQQRLVRTAETREGWLESQRIQVLSDVMGDLVLRFDRSGLVLVASGACERLFGIAAANLMDRGFFDRVHVADRPAFLHAISRAANGVEPSSVNVRFRMSDYASGSGDYVEPVFAWVEIRSRRLGEADNKLGTTPGVVVAAVRDITLRVRHETENENSKQEAEHANASKDRFIAVVSHELRTPLNAIIGFGEMLASPTLAPESESKRREYAEIIRTSGLHLLAVVNSLLDLSKLDAGKFELAFEPFCVSALVEFCCDMVRLKAEEGSIHLKQEIGPGLEPLLGDKRACKQIILNLLSNALKFTPAGGHITVSARPDGNAVLLSVQDTGIGMTPRDLARLGDPFFQVRSDYDRPFEGTGLGLSVVRGLVGLHGGSISVESAPGEGTRIAVRLPLDGRRRDPAGAAAKIDVIARYPRHQPTGADHRMQKIA